MAGDWTVRVEGDEEAQRRVQRLTLLLSDLRSFWPIATRLFIGWVGQQFDTEGGFFGGQWEPLSPGYQAWKDIHFPGRRILQAEGDLRRAATSPTRLVTPTSLTLTIDPYEKHGRTLDPGWFDQGTSRMPARPLLFSDAIPPAAETELEAAASAYVDDLMHRF